MAGEAQNATVLAPPSLTAIRDERLTREELAALTQPARVREREEKLAAVERATLGLRVAVQVTPSLYRFR